MKIFENQKTWGKFWKNLKQDFGNNAKKLARKFFEKFEKISTIKPLKILKI